MSFDFSILDFIQSHLRCGFLDTVLVFITKLGNSGWIWIAVTLLLLLLPKTRKWGLAMAVSLALESLCCDMLLKPLVARPRPFTVNPSVTLLIAPPHGFSFPSGHTGASFAATSALYFSKSRFWIPALLLSAAIAFSRLYLYVHYPTDVFAGALLGCAAGYFGNRLTELAGRSTKEEREA